MNKPELSTERQALPAHRLVEDELRALARLEALLELFTGAAPRRHPPNAEVKFSALSLENRLAVAAGWNSQSDFIEGALDQGLDYLDEVKMLSYALGRLGLLGNADLLSQVSPGDVVEIYGADYVQVYRSYSCFSLCNYSLLELSAYPWYELYERSSAVMKDLVQSAEKIFLGQAAFVDLAEFPGYTIRETMSPEGAVFAMREKQAFRLVSVTNAQPYLLSVKKITEIAENKPDDNTVRYI